MEAAPRFELGIKDLQSSALPLGYAAGLLTSKWSGRRDLNPRPQPWQGCALPLSYFRIGWWRDPESDWGHGDFQSPALPTELSRRAMAGLKRLELSTFGVTGRRSNRLSYNPYWMVGDTGIEPVTTCL